MRTTSSYRRSWPGRRLPEVAPAPRNARTGHAPKLCDGSSRRRLVLPHRSRVPCRPPAMSTAGAGQGARRPERWCGHGHQASRFMGKVPVSSDGSTTLSNMCSGAGSGAAARRSSADLPGNGTTGSERGRDRRRRPVRATARPRPILSRSLVSISVDEEPVVVMRMSTLFLRTLREDPADAEVPSHKLLVRAGYIRRIAAGIYSWLPLGKLVLDNVAAIVRAEMDAIGGQEVLLPALLPREPYELSRRWYDYGPEMFRLQDRRGADYCLGPTHEEMMTLLVKGEYSSYKDLPLTLYQIQTKYRDERRPRSGLIRGREFVMKDSYSFNLDDADQQLSLIHI